MRIEIDPQVIRNFKRLNDRKWRFAYVEFLNAGYPYINTHPHGISIDAYDWLTMELRNRHVIFDRTIFFAAQDDHMLFTLKWL